MATDKLFTVVGVSKLDGEYKVRFANDTMRVKVLEKHGHQDTRLVQLDSAMTKYDAVKTIATWPEFADANAQSAIAEYLDEKAPKVKASKPVAKATKAPAAKATAKVTEDEDAPF
jgi:hypothetical protein